MSRTRARKIEQERPKPSFGSIECRITSAGSESIRAIYRLDGKKQTKTLDS